MYKTSSVQYSERERVLISAKLKRLEKRMMKKKKRRSKEVKEETSCL